MRLGALRVRGIAAAIGTILVLALTSSPVVHAGTPPEPPCRVRNLDRGTGHRTLAAALLAARRWDTLVMTGVCRGDVTVLRAVTIRGRDVDGRNARISGDGDGTTLTLAQGRRLVLADLTVDDGVSTIGAGGIVTGTGSRLELRSVRVFGNTGVAGGIQSAGTLIVRGATRISGNIATGDGGGIRADGGTVIVRDTAEVVGNDAQNGGGVVGRLGATIVFRGRTEVRANSATGDGGGIAMQGGTLRLDGFVLVSRNEADGAGGGVASSLGTLVVTTDATVRRNEAGTHGGGIASAGDTAVRIDGDIRIAENRSAGDGGGLHVTGTLGLVRIAERATIFENVASGAGGGVRIVDVPGGVLLRGLVTVGDNVAATAGGGIALTGSGLRISGASRVLRNTVTTATPSGGGIWSATAAPLFADGCATHVRGNTPDDLVVAGTPGCA